MGGKAPFMGRLWGHEQEGTDLFIPVNKNIAHKSDFYAWKVASAPSKSSPSVIVTADNCVFLLCRKSFVWVFFLLRVLSWLECRVDAILCVTALITTRIVCPAQQKRRSAQTELLPDGFVFLRGFSVVRVGVNVGSPPNGRRPVLHVDPVPWPQASHEPARPIKTPFDQNYHTMATHITMSP